MRIAQVAPLFESVPPKLYGGTERVVSYLTESLVDHHHEVTLFASGDAVTRAELIPCAPHALRLHKACRDTLAYHFLMLEKVVQLAPEFDIIHFHFDYLHFPLCRALHLPQLTTRPPGFTRAGAPLSGISRDATGVDFPSPAPSAGVCQLAGDCLPRASGKCL